LRIAGVRLDISGHYLLYLSLKKESGIPPTFGVFFQE
jgi:hypothetical protein